METTPIQAVIALMGDDNRIVIIPWHTILFIGGDEHGVVTEIHFGTDRSTVTAHSPHSLRNVSVMLNSGFGIVSLI